MIILNSTDDYQIVKSLVAIVDVRSVHCSHSVPERILVHLFSLLEQHFFFAMIIFGEVTLISKFKNIELYNSHSYYLFTLWGKLKSK